MYSGAEVVAALYPQFVALPRAHSLCPEHSTFPGDPSGQGVTVCQDGMLHPARADRASLVAYRCASP